MGSFRKSTAPYHNVRSSIHQLVPNCEQPKNPNKFIYTHKGRSYGTRWGQKIRLASTAFLPTNLHKEKSSHVPTECLAQKLFWF